MTSATNAADTTDAAVNTGAAKRNLSGTAYGRKAATYVKELVEVGPGKPMGEYLRRYWHPVAVSKDITDLPVRRRILCEDLVLFRDPATGKAGAVYESCAHRGASLFFGRVEPGGIRCCYHGWKFDVEGRCVNQPLETNGGNCSVVRQPWYPVEEQYGMLWVYMGPPEHMPLTPRYQSMENLAEDEHYSVSFESMPGCVSQDLPYTWLVNMDNMHDMGHALWLHHLHSGAQFGPAFFYATEANAAELQNQYKYVETEQGVYSDADNPFFTGSIMKVRLETQMPNLRIICTPTKLGEAYHMNWCVPVDDENHYNISVARVTKGGIDFTVSPMQYWDRSNPEVVQRAPSDFEAQRTQGPLPRHSEEHLARSDRGVVMLRRQYMRELKALEKGERLMNLRFEGEDPFIPTWGGSWMVKEAPEGVPPPDLGSGLYKVEPAKAHGDWSLDVKTPMGVQVMTAHFLQKQGALLFGTVTTPDGSDAEISKGQVHGQRLYWELPVTKPFPMTLTFDVTVDGDAVSGTCKAGLLPPSDVKGRRL